jgi:hypothetical protein
MFLMNCLYIIPINGGDNLDSGKCKHKIKEIIYLRRQHK